MEDTILFDIETTGFIGKASTVYLIGAIYYEDNNYHLSQWFADTIDAEALIIEAFISKASQYRYIMHFNGNTFDLPFINKRCEALNIHNKLNFLTSIDIYRLVQKFRKPLCLGSTKQKIIETFLNIDRDDEYDGGKLIKVYEDYLLDNDEEKLKLLMLHNHDDMIGMTKILAIFIYDKLLTTSPKDISYEKYMDEYIVLKATYDFTYPAQFSHSLEDFYIVCYEDTIKVKIYLIKNTLKHYFDNYKDYYYLTVEDMAIHKSVAAYVDNSYKEKATKDNCYIKKNGCFLRALSYTEKDIFREEYNSLPYIEYNDNLFANRDFIYKYYKSIISEMF